MVDVVVVDVIPVMPLVTRLLVSCARLTFDDVLSHPSAAIINFQIMKLCTGEISDNEFALVSISLYCTSFATVEPSVVDDGRRRLRRPG